VGKTRCHHHLAAGAQQLERDLEAHFDAPTGEQRVPPRQVARLAPLLPIQRRARGAERGVEGVKLGELGLARVALHLGRKWADMDYTSSHYWR